MTPTESVHGDFRPGYRWTCSWCRGIGLVDHPDDEMEVVDCPVCSEVRRSGYALEVVQRNVSSAIGSRERVASPAIRSQARFELWQFVPAKEKARCLFVSDSSVEVYAEKWGLRDLDTGESI